MELVCPAGSFPALKAAVDNGADAVYLGFKDDTNARHFEGLNFDDKRLEKGLDYARQRDVKVFIAINTYPQQERWRQWTQAVDRAANFGVDAVIMADPGLLGYAAEKHPDLPLHLSVQGSATSHEALSFYKDRFGIRRAVLPRVLSLPQVKAVAAKSDVDIEVFAFGSLCIMAEGRCHLSSYLTSESPNQNGACSPAKYVRWQEKDGILQSHLNGVLIDTFQPGEQAGYPTLCKGRFDTPEGTGHALEAPTSLNTLGILDQLSKAGVKAVKIEGRQRSPAYVSEVVSVWRNAIDQYRLAPDSYQVNPEWMTRLAKLSEGSQTTIGAYERPWH